MIVQLQLQPVYKVITLLGVLLCLLATGATGISSTIHVDRDVNFVNLTCQDDLNVGPVNATFFYLDSKSGPKSLGPPIKYHNFTLNKTNEGRYTCRTITDNAVNSAPKLLIHKYHVDILLYKIILNFILLIAIPMKLNIDTNQSFTWGKPLVLNCSYQPGAYPNGYSLSWKVQFLGATRIIQDQSVPFSPNSATHELSAPFYTPLFDTRYQCIVTISSLIQSNYDGDLITVSTKEGMYAITIIY